MGCDLGRPGRLATATKLPIEKIEELAKTFGGIVPPDLAEKLAAPITSTDQAITQLQLRSKELSEKPIMMQVEDEGVRNAIRGIEGLKVEATGTPGVVKITAENQEAIDKLNEVKVETQQFNTLTAVPRVDLHTELFRQKLDHANSLIDFLGKEPLRLRLISSLGSCGRTSRSPTVRSTVDCPDRGSAGSVEIGQRSAMRTRSTARSTRSRRSRMFALSSPLSGIRLRGRSTGGPNIQALR
ncbi:hypothetical protein GS918_28220 [Rhodococcus hoagii]|nr:hypothetical protein [Prescottella equi]